MSETPPKSKSALQLIQDIRVYEAEVNEALSSLKHRTNYEPCNQETPLSILLDAESIGGEDHWAIRREVIQALGMYFAADGPSPVAVLRRVYAVFLHMGIEPFSLLTTRERGMMLGDSHGAENWRVQRLCVDPLMRAGAKSIKAPGQKGIEAKAAAAKAAKGNHNRGCKHRWPNDRTPGAVLVCHRCNGTKKNPLKRILKSKTNHNGKS